MGNNSRKMAVPVDENGEEKKCFICGATTNLVRTECCGKWICDDEDEYVPFSYAHNSCHRNHRRYTLCAYHHDNGHKGDWKTCPECRKMAEPEMVAWFGTNEYNWEKMPDPPKFEPTRCHKCGKVIRLPEGGYSHGPDGYTCAECFGFDPARHSSMVDAVRENRALKLKLELRGTKIKRVITIPEDISLFDFHYVIQGLFGFEDDHLWNFRDRLGNEYNTNCNPLGEPLEGVWGDEDYLEPGDYSLGDVFQRKGDVLRYSYDYGDSWEINITRMADPKDDEINCVETKGTNAMEDIGGIWGLAEFTEALEQYDRDEKKGKPHGDVDWRISEWGYDNEKTRREFLAGPSKEELTALLKDEVEKARNRQRKEAEDRKRQEKFKEVGRNDPCPCGSGKKFKKCCGSLRVP